MDTHTCIYTHIYMKGTYMHINAYSTHICRNMHCTDLFLVSNQAMRILEMLKYHTHQTPWEQQVGAATCNSDNIFFFTHSPVSFHPHSQLRQYYFSPPLDQGLGTLLCFPWLQPSVQSRFLTLCSTMPVHSSPHLAGSWVTPEERLSSPHP